MLNKSQVMVSSSMSLYSRLPEVYTVETLNSDAVACICTQHTAHHRHTCSTTTASHTHYNTFTIVNAHITNRYCQQIWPHSKEKYKKFKLHIFIFISHILILGEICLTFMKTTSRTYNINILNILLFVILLLVIINKISNFKYIKNIKNYIYLI